MRLFALAAVLAGLGLAVSACDASDASGTARINVRMTDAPFPFDLAQSADVTITRIELLAAEDDGDASNDTTDAEAVRGRIVLYDGDPVALDLLRLRDGVDTLLVNGFSVPADGSYNRMRIYVGPEASVTFTDGSVFPLKLPSAQRSGIKVALPDYAASGDGDEIDVLIDFNVEESFVTRGNPGSAGFKGFLFKPVLKVKSFEVVAPEAPADSSAQG